MKTNIKNIPKKIYLQIGDIKDGIEDGEDFEQLRLLNEITWCDDKIYETDIEYELRVNMKIIYVVTQGSYSDYEICGVFDDINLAKEFVEAYNSEIYPLEIEEYDLNPINKDWNKNYKLFHVKMDKSGNTLKVSDKSMYSWPPSGLGHSICDDILNNYCLAKDEKHAIKITNEKRTQLIALNLWE